MICFVVIQDSRGISNLIIPLEMRISLPGFISECPYERHVTNFRRCFESWIFKILMSMSRVFYDETFALHLFIYQVSLFHIFFLFKNKLMYICTKILKIN